MSVLIASITVLIMIVLLVQEVYDPLKVFILGVSIMLFFGFINVEEAVSGFSNKGVLTVAVLFVIAGTVERSYVFNNLTKFSNLERDNFKPIKLFLTVTGLSAFLNNTPIVSIFIPIVNRISDKTGISVSKLLIPLSYLSILGGVLTLIGTSTNLVISGLMEDMGMDPLGFFELTKISLPSVFIGVIYIALFYTKRLPDNTELLEKSIRQTNEHLVRFIVNKNSSIIGKTVRDANLRALKGVYLVEIERNGMKVFPITPDEVIKKSDLLIFAGETEQIDELKGIDNLVLETDYQFNTNYFNQDNTMLIEAVVTQPLGKPGLSIKELKFRKKYNAVVIGVIRNGERLHGKLGSIQPRLGDIFLLIAEKGSTGLIEKDPALTIIISEERKVFDYGIKGILPTIVFIATIAFAVGLKMSILQMAIMGVAVLLIANVVQIKELLGMIDYKTIILIAMSFAIGKSLMNSGTAHFIAQLCEPLIMDMHPLPLLMLVFIITNLLTTVITNNAAAIIALPIVVEIISVTSYELRPFLLVMALAASSSFISPYGYQTNTMVYGAGGYKYRDFIYFGYPLVILILVSSTLSAYVFFFI